MKSKLNILQHSLGLNTHGTGRPYRNHFVTHPGSSDFYDCTVLVEMGLMECHAPSELTGGGHCFVVTPAGVDFVSTNSEPAPKLTRGQKNYSRFLAADLGCTFAEWLGIGAKNAH